MTGLVNIPVTFHIFSGAKLIDSFVMFVLYRVLNTDNKISDITNTINCSIGPKVVILTFHCTGCLITLAPSPIFHKSVNRFVKI